MMISSVIPFRIYLSSLQLVAVLCGGRNTSPRTSRKCSLHFLVISDHCAHSGIFENVYEGHLVCPGNLTVQPFFFYL